MIIDDIKKNNIEAMKSKNHNLRSIYSIIINKYMQAEIEARTTGHVMSDDDTIRIIQKTIKELVDEAENYNKVGNLDQEKLINDQKASIEIYLPKMLTDKEISEIILGLEDKSVPYVMRHFKMQYGNKVDMKLVGEIVKKLN